MLGGKKRNNNRPKLQASRKPVKSAVVVKSEPVVKT
jgi:hypothetical protein